jgi:hypothetical protein
LRHSLGHRPICEIAPATRRDRERAAEARRGRSASRTPIRQARWHDESGLRDLRPRADGPAARPTFRLSEERLWDRVGPILAPRFGEQLVEDAAEDDRVGFGERVKHFQDCAEATRAGQLDEAACARCTDPVRIQLGPVILAERKRLQPSVAYQDAHWAEVAASLFVPDAQSDGEYARVFGTPHALGDKPLVVLTHSMWDMKPPFGEISYQSWVAAHRLTAEMSTRGTQPMVPMPRHNIQIDPPQAVIDTVVDVLAALEAP